ncbi:MAG: 2-hydroxyacyl-CoA dehydratase, partial [Deltaproteobacteria bacterium]|nr:2-hydroxyacyl-CoA dehydratase [Deltaproteobacteria bacterium]
MEGRLRHLIESNSEANRTRWVMEWKDQGKKVIGVMSSYVPEEVISAAGMLPFRITGTWREDIPHARVYRSESSCSYCNHVLESLLKGELDFLDGIVIGDIDQDLLRLWDIMVAKELKPFCYAMHIPFVDSELNYQFLRDEIRRLMGALEALGGVQITDDALRSSIDTYNKMRDLLTRVYELRKREFPPITGAETLGLITAATVMPKDIFNKELEDLLPYLKEREAVIQQARPRLLITSEMLDNPAYLELVEESCLVVMDDMDTGSRYINGQIDTTLQDPAYAIAKRYISRHGAPRMGDWDKQIKQIMDWVREYQVDGVLGFPHAWCYPQKYRMPYLIDRLKEAGIPNISLDREYHLANAGQLRTRIGAFVEMLGS